MNYYTIFTNYLHICLQEDIFQMVSAGNTSIEDDVRAIMMKLIKKSIQLQYSGCGKKVNGVGKEPFKTTETFKAMERKSIFN